jgi:hypothetical protein
MSFFHMKRNVTVGRRQVPPNPGQLIRHITSASRGTACIGYELTCYTLWNVFERSPDKRTPRSR